MINRLRNSRTSVLLLLLLVTFPSLIGMLFYALVEQRREARVQAQETALRIARLSAREQERLITGAHHLLMTLAELPEVRERKAARCNEILAGILSKFPYYTNLAAATVQGDIFCTGLSDRSNNPNIADRDYFQEALQERRLGISHVLLGRMSGKPAIALAYPSYDAGGPVHAIVFVGLDLSWLNTIAASAHLPAGARVLAADETGTVFVRYTVGQDGSPTPVNPELIRTIIERREGVTEAADGVRRLYGFTTLHQSPSSGDLYVAVGIPDDVAFASSNRIFRDSLIVILSAAALTAAGAWMGADVFIRRRLERLVLAARALGDGEYGDARAVGTGAEPENGGFDRVVEEMRAALQKATGRQADFAAMIAHDLRNPLQTIHSAVSLLPHARNTSQNEQVFMDLIRHGCEELTRTLNRFLDFSKYRAGYLQLTKEEVGIHDFFAQLNTRYTLRAEQNKLCLVLDVEPGIGSIAADRNKLNQLLDNLLNNAFKFTPAGGEIRMGARSAEGGIEFWVRDTGIGMDDTEVEKLFSRYGQTASSTRSNSKGTGLGLLICKMIAEAHGGQITVWSERGRGTLFRVWLPRPATPMDSSAAS